MAISFLQRQYWRFLYKSSTFHVPHTCAGIGCLCVCVCQPLYLRVSTVHLPPFRAGGHSISLGLCPTKLPVKWDIQLGQLDVPARSLTSCYPTLPRFVSWSFMILPLQQVFHRRLRVATAETLSTCVNICSTFS